MTGIRVVDRPSDAWDAFVRAHPGGTPFHLAAWSECLSGGLRTRPRNLVAEQDGSIVGVLPLHHVRSRLFADRLAGTPQAAYGGPLAVDAGVRARLLEAAIDEGARLGVDYLELRYRDDPGPEAHGDRWEGTDLYVTIGGPIAEDADAILRAIPKKSRADCRKADKVLTASESLDHFDVFHELFAENQHALGTPVLPKRFLRLLVTHAADLGTRILVVSHEGRPVASCLSFVFGEAILPYYAGARSDDRNLRPNHGLYLNVLRRARASGLTWFDFGRSKVGSGSYDFKRRWGFDVHQMDYRYRLIGVEERERLDPQDPRYRRKIEAWKRLPRWAADAVGPWLSPSLS